MSTTKEILDDADLAKTCIANSSMSNEYKKAYLKLINISTTATNGISIEEKIQKMTECIQLLAVTQGMYMINIDQKIEKAIDNANIKQCETCKAMKHANDVEQAQHEKELVDKYMNQQQENFSWQNVLKNILMKPYVYVVACLLIISPYGTDILKIVSQFFGK